MGLLKRATMPPADGTNTISDKDWRELQKRAGQANPDKMRTGRNANAEGARSAKNYDQARKGNN